VKRRNMFYFKACPKCRGDMYLDNDAYGSFRKCLQCGRIFEVQVNQPGVAKAGTGQIAA
jgi:hypothetical protein